VFTTGAKDEANAKEFIAVYTEMLTRTRVSFTGHAGVEKTNAWKLIAVFAGENTSARVCFAILANVRTTHTRGFIAFEARRRGRRSHRFVKCNPE
jgi:hypothetical protein